MAYPRFGVVVTFGLLLVCAAGSAYASGRVGILVMGAEAEYGELADQLIPYVKERGFTHVELLPISEHPFDGSWGYQTIGYYAPTSRFGSPDELRGLVDRFHQAGVGVLLDWVPV